MNANRRQFLKKTGQAAVAVAVAFPFSGVNWCEQTAKGTAKASPKRGAQRLSIEQLQKYEAMQYGIFLHFGMPTFTGYPPSHYRPPYFEQESPKLYNPDKLDVDQWICTARDVGAKYAVLTTKFNDGFCLWPSKLTDYTVANSGNKTDVVAEFIKACDKRGIIPGFYYNSNDAQNRMGSWIRSDRQIRARNSGWPFFTSSLYQTYMTNHITELLKTYGPVAEIWLDLPGELGRGYRTFLYDYIAELHPDTVILYNHGGAYLEKYNVDYAWPSDVYEIEKVSMSTLGRMPPETGYPKWQMVEGKEYYMPAEVSGPIRADNCWFGGGHYGGTNSHEPVSDEALVNLYQACRKDDMNLLLDIAPNKHGLIPDCQVQALKRLRKNAKI